MKKFVFRLATVYKYKQTVEKTQKAELANARAALNALYEERDRLEYLALHVYDDAKTVDDFMYCGRWLENLTHEQAKVRVKITKAEHYVEECQNRLIQTMKELQAYEKLRAEQYAAWQAEYDAAERAELEDYISGNVEVR